MLFIYPTINNYKKKLSGPILDRIDLQIEVPRLKFEKITGETLAEKSDLVRQRIIDESPIPIGTCPSLNF